MSRVVELVESLVCKLGGFKPKTGIDVCPPWSGDIR